MAEADPNTLWCIHVIGPDELIPAASHEAAIKGAAEINAWFSAKPKHVYAPAVSAAAIEWPFLAKHHAAELATSAAPLED